MSDKPRKKKAPGASRPALAKMLLEATTEHEAALARVARLLHDEVSQTLSAVGLQLDALRMDFRDQAPGIDARATEIQSMLEQVIEQLRDISNDLDPSIVERAGLQFALDGLAGQVRAKFSGAVRLHLDSAVHVPTDAAKVFYKIAECAVDEALARPGCTLIDIHLKRSRGEFVLEVHNNGESDEAGPTLPLGLPLMDYYASRNQVALEVKRPPKRGTMVRAGYPAPAADPEVDG